MNIQNIATELSAIDEGIWTPGLGALLKNTVQREDGMQLWFREGGYGNEGKIEIHFSRPVDADGRPPTLWAKSPATGTISNPSIRVSSSKSDKQIAKDIARRLIPESNGVFILATEAIDRDNKYRFEKTATIVALAAVAGCEPSRHYQSKELTGEIDPYIGAGVPSFKGQGYGKIKVSSGDSISIELTSMDFFTARKMVKAIRDVLLACK